MGTKIRNRIRAVNRDLLVMMLWGTLTFIAAAALTPLFGLPQHRLRPVDFLADVVGYGLAALVFDWPVDRPAMDERRSARVLAVILAVLTLAWLALTRSHELGDDASCFAFLAGLKCFQIWFDREEISEWP